MAPDQRSIFEVLLEQQIATVDDERVRVWMAVEQKRAAGHPAAHPECDGCSWWGVCAWHAPPAQPGLPARNRAQADAWRAVGYDVGGEMPPPEDVPQDIVGEDDGEEARRG